MKTLVLITACLFSQLAGSQSHFEVLEETNLTNNIFDDRYASFSPNGKRIIFESFRTGNWDIYIMDSNGESQVQLTSNESSDRRPSWHPDGTTILFESDREDKVQLFTLNLSSGEIKKKFMSTVEGELIFSSFSPDGKYLSVGLVESPEKSNLLLLNEHGEIVKRLTNNDHRNNYAKWSNKSDEIVYFSRKDTDNQYDEIYVLNVESGFESRLTNWPKHNFCPSWSADGKMIAYVTSMDENRPEIFVMDSDGSNKTRITRNDETDTLPNWSTVDNKKILITGYRNGNYEIVQVEIEVD